jgi:hypothetical protein
MAKFYGIVGFSEMKETSPGVWFEDIVEKNCYGDFVKISSRYQQAEKLNDNLVLNNLVSIVADPYINENFSAIRYLTWMGTRWKITNVEVQRPRLILTLGGVYNA